MGSAEAAMPLLTYNRQLLPVQRNVIIRDIPSVSSQSISMACYNGVRLEQIDHLPFNSKCTGKHCDKSEMCVNGQVKKTCACFQMNNRSASPGIAWTLKLTLRDGQQITVSNFSSTRFLFEWIFKSNFSPIIRADHLDDFDARDAIDDGATAVLEEVNNSGGWTVIMWQKLGRVEDAAVKAANEGIYNAPVEYVQAGTVVHHIVSISPTMPETLNPITIREHMVDINEFLEQNR